ncbi:MAG TPA: trypsin-like peptidase domain-containing protein [Gemmataceae bacterium]|nr:trypsin-like peptidase domain-containing protein [Gemmataceae bacterium]
MPSYEDYEFPSRPRRHRGAPAPWSVIIVLGVLVLLGGLAVGYFIFRGDRRPAHDQNAQPREVTPRGDRDVFEKERIRVFKDVSPSVVNVDTLRIQRAGYRGQVERMQGTGSGFVWDDDGRIVTNYHVVQDTLQVSSDGTVSVSPSARIRITLADRPPTEHVRLVGVAPDHDLAVLQVLGIPSDKLRKITVGSSADLEVGQTVYAIGNPFGQTLTFTHGIVSALDREIQSVTDRPITGVIQTDASLNPGNSGGPLLDREGRLVGVNTAIASPSGGSVGIGYAIPVDTVNQVVTELIRTGRPTRPALGIVTLREQDTRALGYDKGVMIAEVRPGSAAAKAGLVGFREDPDTGEQLYGDVIMAVNGEPIDGMAEFRRVMTKLKVGQTVKLTILRGKQTREVSVTLEGI